MNNTYYLVFREGGPQLGCLCRAESLLYPRPHGPVVRTGLRDNIQMIQNGFSSLYRALAVKHEGCGDDLLPVLPGAAEMVLAVAVKDLLPRLDSVLSHEIGLVTQHS